MAGGRGGHGAGAAGASGAASAGRGGGAHAESDAVTARPQRLRQLPQPTHGYRLVARTPLTAPGTAPGADSGA